MPASDSSDGHFHRDRRTGRGIGCLPWQAFLDRWDRPEAMVYVDPPYYGTEPCYRQGPFSKKDFGRLAVALKQLKGRFVITINDCTETWDIFGGWEMEAVGLGYTVSGKMTAAGELVIMDIND